MHRALKPPPQSRQINHPEAGSVNQEVDPKARQQLHLIEIRLSDLTMIVQLHFRFFHKQSVF